MSPCRTQSWRSDQRHCEQPQRGSKSSSNRLPQSILQPTLLSLSLLLPLTLPMSALLPLLLLLVWP